MNILNKINLIKYQKIFNLFHSEFKKFIKEINHYDKNIIRTNKFVYACLNSIYLNFSKINKSFNNISSCAWMLSNFCYQFDAFIFALKDHLIDRKWEILTNKYAFSQEHYDLRFVRKMLSHPFNFTNFNQEELNKFLNKSNHFNVLLVSNSFWNNEGVDVFIRVITKHKWIKKQFKDKLKFPSKNLFLELNNYNGKDYMYLEVNLYDMISKFVNQITNTIFVEIKNKLLI